MFNWAGINMAGGSAQAMKISDVFIVVGISILVAGFIMHAWVIQNLMSLKEKTWKL